MRLSPLAPRNPGLCHIIVKSHAFMHSPYPSLARRSFPSSAILLQTQTLSYLLPVYHHQRRVLFIKCAQKKSYYRPITCTDNTVRSFIHSNIYCILSLLIYCSILYPCAIPHTSWLANHNALFLPSCPSLSESSSFDPAPRLLIHQLRVNLESLF